MEDELGRKIELLASFRYASTQSIVEEDLTRGLLNVMTPAAFPKESQTVAKAILRLGEPGQTLRRRESLEASLPIGGARVPDLLISDNRDELRAVIEVKFGADINHGTRLACPTRPKRRHRSCTCQLCWYRCMWECRQAWGEETWTASWSNAANTDPTFILLARDDYELCTSAGAWKIVHHDCLSKALDQQNPALDVIRALLSQRALPLRLTASELPITGRDLSALHQVTSGSHSLESLLRSLTLAQECAEHFIEWTQARRIAIVRHEDIREKDGSGWLHIWLEKKATSWIRWKSGDGSWAYVGVFTGEATRGHIAYGQIRHPPGVLILGGARDRKLNAAVKQIEQTTGKLGAPALIAPPTRTLAAENMLKHELSIRRDQKIVVRYFRPIRELDRTLGDQADEAFNNILRAVEEALPLTTQAV